MSEPRGFWIDVAFVHTSIKRGDMPDNAVNPMEVMQKQYYDELKAKADKLVKILGMLDCVGVAEPYNKIVHEAIKEWES